MKFVIDVSVGAALDTFMKNSTHDVLCIRDIDPRMDDNEILKIADRENRILITMDKDFGELIYKYSLKHCGVLLLRLEDESTDEKIKVISKVLNNHAGEIQNSFCTYKNNILRIKK